MIYFYLLFIKKIITTFDLDLLDNNTDTIILNSQKLIVIYPLNNSISEYSLINPYLIEKSILILKLKNLMITFIIARNYPLYDYVL